MARAKPKADEVPVGWARWPQDQMRPLAQMRRHPKNPKTHPPAQIALLAELLKKFGPDQPIVLDEDDYILKGNGRHEAAALAGIEAFPFVRRSGLSEADKVALLISDNQVPLLGGWDKELVRGHIGSLRASGYELRFLGFGDTQLVQFETLPGPPGSFPTFGENIDTKFCCPRCQYKWSGNPKAGEDPEEVAEAKKTAAKPRRKKS